MKKITVGQKIKHKKSGKVFTVLGFVGGSIELRTEDRKKFLQASFSVHRDYEAV